MTHNEIRGDIPVYTATAALLVILLIVDAATPLGYAEWVLYFLPIGATLFQSRRMAPFVAAGFAVAFNALGLVLSPEAGSLVQSIINRAVGALAQLAMAFLVWQVLREREQTQALTWLQRGQATVTQALLGEQSVSAVAARAVRLLAEILGADAAVLYFADGTGLVRQAGHAIDEASVPEHIALGQGVVGEVARTGKLQRLRAPPGHLHSPQVVSALGRSTPQGLLVAPLMMGPQPLGVVELAFLDRHADLERAGELLERCGEDVATALRAALFREREAQLLEETQRQSEELQAQQEELRVANEELEGQSRVLQESNARLENQQAELEQTNVQLEEQAQALQRQKARLLEVQQELRLNADRLAATNRYKSEFLANMSHELRTPLNSSMILAKLLADNRDDNLSPEQVKYARTILAANNDLLSLINDILDLSKIEAGRVEFAVEPLVLQELLEHLKGVVEPMARQKGLGFQVEAAEGAPPLLHTDGKRLQQILKNLLANAVKFTDSGSVALTVRRAPGQRVRFEVRDTGIGIARDQQELIFEAFRQADGSTSRRYGGTGLGLSISRELAQRMGGGIGVESEPGVGSCFTLDLPVDASAALQQANQGAVVSPAAAAPAEAKPPAGPAPAPSAAPPAADRATGDIPRRHPGRLILAVEDDPAFARVLAELADEQGFDAVVAGSAQDALQMARELRPNAVLLDVVLPDSSGLSVLEQLKRDPATRHIPVHMVSAYERTQPAMELGAVGYVMKPARREDLEAAIRRLEHRLQNTVRHLLIVEDDATLRDNLQLLLQGDETRITAVGTVEEALQQLRQSSFDCMVTDLTLPDGSGYDLLERMAANGALSFPPVIVYTGRALTRDEEQRLRRYSKSIIVKGARSPERLVDEVTLFLHSVEATLPADQQRLLRQARRRDSVLEGRRILLAEDDVRNVFALTGVFEPLGVHLVVARNGREALEKLDDGGADLVLMDVMMPEMDGLAAMRAIRERSQWRQLPIIALTAKAMSDDRERCLDAGANDYIAKPIDVDKLVSLCRVWMPK